MSRSKLLFLCLMSLRSLVRAVPDGGSDLESYVSRPDLRPPRFQINVHEPDLVTPGYYFVAPYGELQEGKKSRMYMTAQTGPHIYDHNGDLIWSGAHLVEQDRATFDFKASEIGGVPHLSVLVLPASHSSYFPGGVGLVIDSNLSVSESIQSHVGSGVVNMHEFNLVDDGNSVLMVTDEVRYEDLSSRPGSHPIYRSIGNPGFVEKDLETGAILFEWRALGHVDPMETHLPMPSSIDDTAWDWFHLNSVDKDANGDYLLSSRYTNTVYKISGTNGSVIWRLGGRMSSFALEGDLNFSSQHDARFRNDWHQQSWGADPDEDVTYISLLNNGGDDIQQVTSISSGMIISLNHRTRVAALVRSYSRPDYSMTRLRGNLQLLEGTNNVLCSWSENAYLTEFTSDGQRVLDASFASDRFVTYRAYKFNFSSHPLELPVAKVLVFGEDVLNSVTAWYVSFNGATDVVRWRFYGSKSWTDIEEDFELVGTVHKAGFETVHMASGCYLRSYAQALAVDGRVLGETIVQESQLPAHWLIHDGKAALQIKPLEPADEVPDFYEEERELQPPTSRSSPRLFVAWWKSPQSVARLDQFVFIPTYFLGVAALIMLIRMILGFRR